MNAIPGLSLTLSAVLLFAACGTTIPPGQRGIKYVALAEPALEKEVRQEGFYWQWPWNDVVKYDVTWQSSTEKVDVLTAEALHIFTNMTVTYRPDPERLYEMATSIGPEYYKQVIRPAFMTLARAEFARHHHNDVARDSPQIEVAVLAKLREALRGKPLQVDRVSIDHVDFDAALTRAISAKLEMEQAVARKAFELEVAEKDAEIARTRARGEADAVRIRAEGESSAIVLKGDAQAQAQAAIAKTLSPGYLQYKAFDTPATRYYFLPTGKNNLPIIVGSETAPGAAAGSRTVGVLTR